MLEVLVVAVTVLAFALVSRRLAASSVTAPMVFTGVGLAVGSGGLGWFDLTLDNEAAQVLVEATLVLVLFSDAARIDLRALRRQARLPGRLLGIGLPLSVLVGAAAAVLIVPGLDLVEGLLLAAVLAPTDAALGRAVVDDQRLPSRVRQTINVESGLNDGIALPLVTVLLALVAVEEAGGPGDWFGLVSEQVGFGVLAGLLVGGLGGRLLAARIGSGAVEGAYRQLATLSLAAAAYATASLLDGNGFIAAFTAGLAFAGAAGRRRSDEVQEFAEDEGELLSAVTFLLFGALLAGPVLDGLAWPVAAYVVASLTVVRGLPVLLALVGSGTLWETRFFLAWFGPRGLASILFILLVATELDSPAATTIVTVATWTVLVSVVAHGVTAHPWAGRLARRLEAHDAPTPETEPAHEHRTRRGPTDHTRNN